MTEAVHPSVPDPEGLIGRLKAQEPEAIAAAYRICFGGEVGRFVLAHILFQCGLGARRTEDQGAESRAYHDGRLSAAIDIADTAGFGAAEVVTTVMTQTDFMEGRSNERSSYADPNPEFE